MTSDPSYSYTYSSPSGWNYNIQVCLRSCSFPHSRLEHLISSQVGPSTHFVPGESPILRGSSPPMIPTSIVTPSGRASVSYRGMRDTLHYRATISLEVSWMTKGDDVHVQESFDAGVASSPPRSSARPPLSMSSSCRTGDGVGKRGFPMTFPTSIRPLG